MSFKSLTLISKLFIIPVALTIYACGTTENNTDQKEDTAAANEVKEELQKVLTDVPEPSEMPYQLKATGAEFNPKLPNPSGSVEKYKTTNNKAALNLGVFATDVGYVSVYEKVQEALDYIDATKTLGDKLGVSNAFDPQMRERFENNLSSIDTLTKIIDEALKQSDKYLKDNERNSIAAMIFTGSFVEGLYVSTQLVETYPKDLLPEEAKNEVLLSIVRLITEQDKPLEDLINALKSLEKEEDVDKLISQLEELLKLYKELNIKDLIEKNRGDLILTNETIQGITKKVKEIRSEIVG
ncbi:MAG: hypothetical protein NW226_23300 [Microscillaceae bacterium]|nr:hypothetical protein [Microscillaceae bacterium]